LLGIALGIANVHQALPEAVVAVLLLGIFVDSRQASFWCAAIGATEHAIVECLECNAFPRELALGVFVAVEAQLGVERKIAAELEEERPTRWPYRLGESERSKSEIVRWGKVVQQGRDRRLRLGPMQPLGGGPRGCAF
jgi:hypothetical protein